MTLWSKGKPIDEVLVRFCAGDDASLDQTLLGADLLGTRAHVLGLFHAGHLGHVEKSTLVRTLDELRASYAKGELTISPNDEDSHSCIERILCERLGDLGKRVHLGRSRNDQVLASSRLFARAEIDGIATHVQSLVADLLMRAEKTKEELLVGYTHLQRAVPSTWGFWFAGHAESLLDDLQALQQARALLNRSPLGTAAGYGVNLNLARDVVAEELNFDGLIINGQCAQNGRGKIEAHVLSALLMVLQTIRRASWDLSLYASAEFAFVRLPDRFCTGSSIMPQKRNPDVVEILRGTYSEVAGLHAQLLQLSSLPSGYQRDVQFSKRPLVVGLQKTHEAVQVFAALMIAFEIQRDAIAKAFDAGMLSTDKAVRAAASGVPFRDAYEQASLDDDDVLVSAKRSVSERVSFGGAAALGLERLHARLKKLSVI